MKNIPFQITILETIAYSISVEAETLAEARIIAEDFCRGDDFSPDHQAVDNLETLSLRAENSPELGRITEDTALLMFGMPFSQVTQEKPPFYSPLLWVMAILSDVQAKISGVFGAVDPDSLEISRHWINKAKFWISEEEKLSKINKEDTSP